MFLLLHDQDLLQVCEQNYCNIILGFILYLYAHNCYNVHVKCRDGGCNL